MALDEKNIYILMNNSNLIEKKKRAKPSYTKSI
jgi:hypothetical protein